jgi:hypothetical protein
VDHKAVAQAQIVHPQSSQQEESQVATRRGAGDEEREQAEREERGKKRRQKTKERAERERQEQERIVREEAVERTARKHAKHEVRERAEREAKEHVERIQQAGQERNFTDAEQGPSSPEPIHPALAPEVMPEAFSNSTLELLKTPRGVKEEVPISPKPWPAPSLTSTQPQVSTPTTAPVKTEPEKPLFLWERKKPKAAKPASVSDFSGSDEETNSSGGWGDAGGGGSTETIAMPAITGNGDRQSIFTDTARDQKRENQRENLVEGFLGSNQSRRRNDSPQQQMASKPTPRHAPAPAPAPAQRSSGWGSWGSSLLNTVANVATDPVRTPSPELPSVRLKFGDPPRGFTPNRPPKSQPAGFGSSNKPAPTFGSETSKKLTVDTTMKPMESSPNTAGPENIPESAVEIKHVPAP